MDYAFGGARRRCFFAIFNSKRLLQFFINWFPFSIYLNFYTICKYIHRYRIDSFYHPMDHCTVMQKAGTKLVVN